MSGVREVGVEEPRSGVASGEPEASREVAAGWRVCPGRRSRRLAVRRRGPPQGLGAAAPAARDLRQPQARAQADQGSGAEPTAPSASARWPRPEWRADLPLLAERVDDPPEPPPVLIAHRRDFCRASGYRPPDNRVRVFDHEER